MKALKNRWGGLFVFLLVLSTVVFFGCPSEAPQPTPGLELDGEFITYYNQNSKDYSVKFDAAKQEFTFKLQEYDSNFNIKYVEHTVKYRYVDDKIQTYAADFMHTGYNTAGEMGNYEFNFQYEIKINPDDSDSVIVKEIIIAGNNNKEVYEDIYVKKDVEKSYLDGTWVNGAETLYVDSDLYELDEYSALLEKNGKIAGYGDIILQEGHKNYFGYIIKNDYPMYDGWAIASKNKLYIKDSVSNKIVVFSKKSDSVKVFSESQNKYIGEYKSINGDTLTIDNSKISVNMEKTVYEWTNGFKCTPKAAELKYSYDIFTDVRGYILGTQNLQFDILNNDNEVNETTEALTTFYLEPISDKMMELKQVFNIYGKRGFTEYFVKVINDVDFVGTWTTKSTADGLESVSFTVNENNTYILVTNGEEEVGTFDVETANEENYFSYDDYFKGLIAADGSLYLKFLYTHNTKGEPYYAQLFFTKQ